MKKLLLVLFAVILLIGCSKSESNVEDEIGGTSAESGKPEILPAFGGILKMDKVESYGEIPGVFQNIVEHNLFNDVYVFEDVILKHYNTSAGHTLHVYDYKGYPLAYYSNTDVNLMLSAITPTEDGGFVFVLCNPSNYNFYSGTRIVKCDSTGKVIWEREYEHAEGLILNKSIQYNGNYFFFGSYFRDSSSSVDQSRRRDIWVLKYSNDGDFIKRAVFGGSGFDEFENAEISEDGIRIYCTSSSEDGDFAKKGSHLITLDFDLNTRSIVYGEDYLSYYEKVGVLENKTVYREDFEKIAVKYEDASGYDFSGYCYVGSIIDYGEFYLAVVDHSVGVYENTPSEISSTWHYTETVYSAFDKNGRLLWRGTVDSSPDFESLFNRYKD